MLSKDALEMLQKMKESAATRKSSRFDSTFFLGVPNAQALLNELENSGYVEQLNDIIGSVILTTDY